MAYHFPPIPIITDRECLVTACSGLLAAIGIAAVLAAAPAQADPDDGGVGSGPSKVHYCPDTGQMVSWLAPCPSLITGPYLPGGLVPNGGSDR